MPEHTSFLSYLIAMFPALGENMSAFGKSLFGKPVDGESHAEFSPEVSVIHDFLLKLVNPAAVDGSPAPGEVDQPFAHQFHSVGVDPAELTPSPA